VNYIGADHYTEIYFRNESKLDDMRTKLGLKDSAINMVYIGRLNPINQPYKGVKDLVEIFKKSRLQLPNLNLIMAGYGSEDDQRKLEVQGIKVIRNAPDEDLLLLLDLCDFYVSATKWEGFNLPMIESQSFGKIPIIYDIGPHSELTNSGIDSFVVKSQDAFVEKVVFLSKNPGFRQEKAELAKENSKKYSWRESAINLDKIIRNKK
jgi:glycosyltransferase involved in cell wall biosynthesis